MKHNEPPVLFIGGTGRCGSSILREALGQHSLCGVLEFEHRFLIDPDGLVDFYTSYDNTWSPYNYDLRVKRLSRLLKTLSGGRIRLPHSTDWHLPQHQYKGWNLEEFIPNIEALIDELINNLTDFQFDGKWVGGREFDNEKIIFHSHCRSKLDVRQNIQTFAWTAINDLLSGLGKSIYVEDNTWNSLYTPQLLELFPTANFIHIYRHPCDVITSFLSQSWCPNNIEQATMFYKSLMDRWFQIKKELPSERVLEISYEAFISDPTFIYKKICAFLGITFEDAMMKTKVVSTAQGQWKNTLSENEQSIVYESVKYYIDALGYSADST